jgi:hypothetical protein
VDLTDRYLWEWYFFSLSFHSFIVSLKMHFITFL